jgi:hypothetical protein
METKPASSEYSDLKIFDAYSDFLASLNLHEANSSATKINQSIISTFEQKEESYYEFFKIAQEITGIYIFPFICIFGIIGNVFNVIVYKNSDKRSANLYLITLSLSDVVKLLNDFAYFLVNLISKLDISLGERIFNKIYFYSHYIFVFTALNTSWLTCAIALERYISICTNRSGKSRRFFSNYFHSLLISLFIFIVSALFAAPSPFFLELVVEQDNLNNMTTVKLKDSKLAKSSFKTVYRYFNALVRAILPLFLLIILNYQILKVIYKNKINKHIKKKQKSKSSVTMMLATIVLVFIICIFPDAIMTMMQLGYANENYLVRGIREITDLLLAINSASTFLICFSFSIQYRTKFKQIFLNQKSNLISSDGDENENASLMKVSTRTKSIHSNYMWDGFQLEKVKKKYST